MLDAHQHDPAVAPGRIQEHRALAVSAGLARLDEPAAIAAARGRQLVGVGQAASESTAPESTAPASAMHIG